MTTGAPFAEFASLDELARREAEWAALGERALESNVFAQSAFLLPALKHLAPARLQPLLIWRDEARSALIGLIALAPLRFGFGLARAWRSEQAALAAAMFDREAAAEALAATLAWLRRERPNVTGLVLPDVEPAGDLARAIEAVAASGGLRLERVRPRRRAALRFSAQANADGADKKRRKEWARQARRLAERGRLETRALDDEGGVARFLALEAQGWKGARGTALGADPARDAFAREALAAFQRRGQLRVEEITLDDAPVAMGIALVSGRRAFYWKTAYDEAFAEYSPGVQVTRALGARLASEPALELVDSCAISDHPMIDGVWRDRLDLADFALAAAPGAGASLGRWLAIEGAYASAREAAKRRINHALGRART